MNIIIKNDNFEIVQDLKDNKSFTIFFNSYNEALIKSLLKTRIILGATTTEKYKSLTFKATRVQTFLDFQKELERENKSLKLPYNLALKMTYNLVTQLNYLITHFSQTFLGYSPENLIIVDTNKFIYLSNEFLLDIKNNDYDDYDDNDDNDDANDNDDDEKNILIKYPFTINDFFWSPELSQVKEIPSFINYKVSYFSLGCLLLYGLLGDDDFIKDDEEHLRQDKIKIQMNTLFIKNTKLYWLLERCLVEEPKNRSILFI
jgi:hypothetical protein